MIYIYGISHVIRNWDLVTESLYVLFRNGLWADPRVHPITRERATVRTTIQQHHKSRQANNKIPVAHTHHMSFCLRHLHTCHLPTLSFSFLVAALVFSSSSSSYPFPFICLRKFLPVFKFPESRGSPFTIHAERRWQKNRERDKERKKEKAGYGV